MAVNISLLSSSNTNNINTNFTRVATALQDVVGRSGSTPNQMNADLDMNSNDILNVNNLDVENLLVDGENLNDRINAALEAADSAEADALSAEEDADRAEAYAALIGSATNRLSFRTVAELIADTTMGYSASSIIVGTSDIVEAQGFRYTVAASGASDNDIVTAGGVKLYVLESAAGYMSLLAFGAKGDNTTDDTDATVAWLAACEASKSKGYVPKGDYRITYIDETYSDDLVIECHSQARFYGFQTQQEFPGNGVTTAFTVTTWNVSSQGFRVDHIDSLGVRTTWTENTQYTVAGQVITTTGGNTVASGDKLRVSDGAGIFNLRSDTIGEHYFSWKGGIIDNSLRGLAYNVGSGSGLTIQNWGRFRIDDVLFQGTTDHETSTVTGFSDSGLQALGCVNGVIVGCTCIGQGDVGMYITGSGSTGPEDDGGSIVVVGNHFIKTGWALRSNRNQDLVVYMGNTFDSNELDIGVAPIIEGRGQKVVIIGNTSRFSGRGFADVRYAPGAVIANNTIRDFGFELDGTTPFSGAGAIKLHGCEDVVCTNNIIRMEELTSDAAQIGVHMLSTVVGATTYQPLRNIVKDNLIHDVAIGVRESSAGSGQLFEGNTIVGATTAYSVLATRNWNYFNGTTYKFGTGTQDWESTWTPVLSFGTPGNLSIAYSVQVGRYVRQGNKVLASGTITTSSFTHTTASGTMTISGLPFPSKNVTDINYYGSMRFRGITKAGYTQIVPRVRPNVSFIDLQASGSGQVPAGIAAADMPTGGSVSFEFSVEYLVD